MIVQILSSTLSILSQLRPAGAVRVDYFNMPVRTFCSRLLSLKALPMACEHGGSCWYSRCSYRGSWTVISLLACAFLAVAAACQRAADSSARMLELIPVTVLELLRQLRDAWALWRRRHQYSAQQANQRWHADETPR